MSIPNTQNNEQNSNAEEKPINEWSMEELMCVIPARGYALVNPETRPMYEHWLTLQGFSESVVNALNDRQMSDIYDDRTDTLLRTLKKMRAMDVRSRPATLDGLQVRAARDLLNADALASSISDGIIKAAVAAFKSGVTMEDVRKVVREELPLRHSQRGGGKRVIEIKRDDYASVTIEGIVHKEFSHVLAMATKDNVMLVGGAGSGKTTLARQVAKALNLPFYFTGAVPHEAKLLGFINPHGQYVGTAFHKAWTQGGVFLMDEIDASDPQALLSINAALDNGICDFPCGMVEKHKDFHFIGAANTFGKGATMEYIGRNAQDEAGRSRWYYVTIDYDENMEEAIASNLAPVEVYAPWCRYIRLVRAAVLDLGERHVVSPRSTIKGIKALAAGISRDRVENAVLWHGMEDDRRKRILDKAKELNKGVELP